MLNKGLYISEDTDHPYVPVIYEITVRVSETDKAFVLTLIDFNSRYGATQINDMFSRSKRVVIKKSGSIHGVKVWSDNDFTLYPYRAGVPFYFKRKREEINHE